MTSKSILLTDNPPQFDYKEGYLEMRNQCAFILNIISGEICDDIIEVDRIYIQHQEEREQFIKYQKKKAVQVLKLSSKLIKKPIATTLQGHDRQLKMLGNCLLAINTLYPDAPKPLMVQTSESLDNIRCA